MALDETPGKKTWVGSLASFALATAGVIALSVLINAFQLDLSVGNISMLYLLVVIACALFLGRGPAIWASLSSFLAFNWFFVNPRYTLNVHESGDWLLLGTFLLIATITGQLMALLKARALEARQHQRETAALAEASWAVASQLDTRSALQEVLTQVSKVVELDMAAVIVLDDDASANGKAGLKSVPGTPRIMASYPESSDSEKAASIAMQSMVPQKVHDIYAYRPMATSTNSDGIMFLPIVLKERNFGFVFIKLPEKGTLSIGQKQIIDTLVSQSAVILQRELLMKSDARAQALADADRLKTALLSMVSHDFRSPLTSIKASVSTLMEDGEPLDGETQLGLYQAIDQETDRLNRMVGNILDLSRLEAQAWQPKLEATPVSELIGMALDSFSHESNSRIDVKLDQSLSEVNVDCVQMVQVMKNLIENALKYSNQKERVEIRSFTQDDKAILEVLDRGRGFVEGEIEHLFEPFYRGKNLQESSVPGVGVGLAVCRGLVEAHDGNLAAENRQGGGAIFRVTLPLNSAEKIDA